MNILIATSSEHLKYFSVMLESLYMNHMDRQISVYILHSSKEKIDWDPILEQACRYENTILTIPVDEEMFSAFPRASSNWPRVLYFKLLAANLLPDHLDRVLLLESDMIIQKSVSALYDMPFHGKAIIACRNLHEYWGNISRLQGINQLRLKKNLGIKEEAELFGAGVIVLNLIELREIQVDYELLQKLARKFRYSWGSPEESLFWALFYDSRVDADPWSYYLLPIYWEKKKGSLENKRDSYGSIIHYTLCGKPWDGPVLNHPTELDDIWWSYAEKTSFYSEIKERYDARYEQGTNQAEILRRMNNIDLYYNVLIRWKYIESSRDASSISEYLSRIGLNRIAVFGVNPLQMLLCTELELKRQVSVSYLVDSFESRVKGAYDIKKAADCQFNDVDAIVVASFLHFNEIKNSLLHVSCPILSLEDLIEELLPDSFNPFVM